MQERYPKRSTYLISTIFSLLVLNTSVNADQMPSSPSVQSGKVSITGTGTDHIQINQSTNKSIINWNSFSIHKQGRVDFNMPSSSSASLNRVTGSTPSTISGKLNSNGNVFLINPNGVVISPSGVVKTGSFTASSLEINNKDFLNDNFSFKATPESRGVKNGGRISVGKGGSASLLGRYVSNSGIVEAKLGKIAIGSGDSITLNFNDNKMMNIIVPTQVLGAVKDVHGRTLKSLITNTGQLKAQGGIIELSAEVANALKMGTINIGSSGSVIATSYDKRTGKVTIGSPKSSYVDIAGKIDVSSRSKRLPSGHVSIQGKTIFKRGSITANGQKGGDITLLSKDLLALDGNIEANGSTEGGKIIVMSENTLIKSAQSKIQAKGNDKGGEIRSLANLVNVTSGELNVDSDAGEGGIIDVEGNEVHLTQTVISAKGIKKGGKVRIGGEFQGGKRQNYTTDEEYYGFVNRYGKLKEIKNAKKTYVDKKSSINITSDEGNAGTAIIWSDELTDYKGEIEANGSQANNTNKIRDGGFVEISSKGDLREADLTRTYVKGGHLLLDPKNITINNNFDTGLDAEDHSGYFADNFSSSVFSTTNSLYDGDVTSINLSTLGDSYTIQWRGYYLARTSGTHTFETRSDDSSWLWVMDYDNLDIKDGFSDLLGLRSSSNEVVDNSGLHGTVTRTGTVSLDAHEYHPILIYFGENAGGDNMRVRHTVPGGSATTDGSGYFFNAGNEYGAGTLSDYASVTGTAVTRASSYTNNQSGTSALDNNIISNMLAAGTDVTLRASNDITLNGAISAPTSNSSTFVMQAGRDITVNADITTNNGNLTMRANGGTGLGVINAQRDAGNADITNNATINAGSGDINVIMDSGGGITNAAYGDISLGNMTGGSITVQTVGTPNQGTISSGTLNASGTGSSAISIEGYEIGNLTLNNTGSGNWKVYRLRSDTDNDFTGVPTADFIQYGYSDGDSLLGSGDGIMTGYDPGAVNLLLRKYIWTILQG